MGDRQVPLETCQNKTRGMGRFDKSICQMLTNDGFTNEYSDNQRRRLQSTGAGGSL